MIFLFCGVLVDDRVVHLALQAPRRRAKTSNQLCYTEQHCLCFSNGLPELFGAVVVTPEPQVGMFFWKTVKPGFL